jgi:hypothetical protein
MEPKHKFLLDSGLLFEINRRILHPFGLALDIVFDENSDSIGYRILESDQPEGFIFFEDNFLESEARFKKFMDETGNLKLSVRKSLLGFEEQVSADQGNSSERVKP